MNTSKKTLNATKVPALIITLFAIIMLGYVLWIVDTQPRTDDAYVYADIINVVPEVSGRIIELPIMDNQEVRKGDLLFRIDPRLYKESLNAAHARLASLNEKIILTQRSVDAQQFFADSMKAAVRRSQVILEQTIDSYNRKKNLSYQRYVSAEELEQALTSKRSAQADLESTQMQAKQAIAAISSVKALEAQKEEIKAQIATAELNLEHTVVRAPFDGRVASLRTTIGQYASAQRAIFTLIDTSRWYVIANFRETDLKNVRPGIKASLYLMSDTQQRFEGEVESVSYGVLPDDGSDVSAGLPKVKRSINWVHVSQRFPVRIAVKDPLPELFRIGTSAVATLYPEPAR